MFRAMADAVLAALEPEFALRAKAAMELACQAVCHGCSSGLPVVFPGPVHKWSTLGVLDCAAAPIRREMEQT